MNTSGRLFFAAIIGVDKLQTTPKHMESQRKQHPTLTNKGDAKGVPEGTPPQETETQPLSTTNEYSLPNAINVLKRHKSKAKPTEVLILEERNDRFLIEADTLVYRKEYFIPKSTP